MVTTERKHITMQMWADAGSFDKIANPGDTVDEEIVEQMMNCLPPLYYHSHYRQCSEPVSHQKPKGRNVYAPTFTTFRKIGEKWVYVGNCFKGESEHAEKETDAERLQNAIGNLSK